MRKLQQILSAGLLALLAHNLPAQADTPALAQSDVAAGFTIYVGGVLFVEGQFKASVTDGTYRLDTYMETTGIAHRFYPAVYKLMSKGRIVGESVVPDKFVSDTVARDDKRLVTITYDKKRMPQLSATPPYSDEDLNEVTREQQHATQDPASAFLLPVSASTSPCARTVEIFDGKRRFNLVFAHLGTKKISPRDTSAPNGWGPALDTVACTMRFDAIAPPAKKRRFTTMLRGNKTQNNEMKIWFATFDSGRVYLPVRFEVPTPIGAAVMELTNLTTGKPASPELVQKSIRIAPTQEASRF